MAKLLSRYILFFAQVIISFLSAATITLCISLLIIMHDRVFLDKLENALCSGASKAFECNFNAQVDRFDCIHGTIFLTDIVVLPEKNRNWFWTSDSISLGFDWAKLFFEQKVILTISCGIMHIDTQIVDGNFAIVEHIKAFTREKVMPIEIVPEKLHIQKAHIALHHDAQKVFECCISGSLDLINNKQHVGLTAVQDHIMLRNQLLAKDLKLSLKSVTDSFTKQSSSELQGSFKVPTIFDDSCIDATIAGKFLPDANVLSAHAGPLTITTDIKSTATVSLGPLSFNLTYRLEPDHIAVTLTGDGAQKLLAELYYDGHYTVQASTEFIQELIQKNILPVEYQKLYSTYSELFAYKTPFSIKGMGTAQYLRNRIDFPDLHIRIPYTYNFLRSCHSTIFFGYDNGYLLLRDTMFQTDRGRVISAISTLGFDANADLLYAHVPIIVQDFFINQAKDFFAELSGACTIHYQKDDRSKIEGICTIKKCHIRNNPFSGEVGNDIVAATINPFEGHQLAQTTDLDIRLHSYEPVEIKTAFLHARAQVALQVLGTISDPQLYGHIELLQGTLHFPYKPLEIRYGKIFFVDNERDDPAIELCASAVIKNYAITLTVDGTARNPVISFQSTPSLQEEQIIGLLFGGAPDSSLSLVMPLSSMGMVEKLIVGSSDEFTQGDGLKSWLGSLQNVKIVPRFSDQTSRGGIRGALAIEVNENLSALIQQNFSLSEDVLIEVAYKPLDELTIRGMRDERGDFGGEIEARLTW